RVPSSTLPTRRSSDLIAFYSTELEVPQITDYLTRVVQPKLQALSGVGKAQLLGRTFALRIWLDPERLAAVDMTPVEVAAKLRAKDRKSTRLNCSHVKK